MNALQWKRWCKHLEQSTLDEIVNETVIPQSPGSALAASAFAFICLADDLMQAQAAFLSAEDEAADSRAETPEQQAAVGFPVPFCR